MKGRRDSNLQVIRPSNEGRRVRLLIRKRDESTWMLFCSLGQIKGKWIVRLDKAYLISSVQRSGGRWDSVGQGSIMEQQTSQNEVFTISFCNTAYVIPVTTSAGFKEIYIQLPLFCAKNMSDTPPLSLSLSRSLSLSLSLSLSHVTDNYYVFFMLKGGSLIIPRGKWWVTGLCMNNESELSPKLLHASPSFARNIFP